MAVAVHLKASHLRVPSNQGQDAGEELSGFVLGTTDYHYDNADVSMVGDMTNDEGHRLFMGKSYRREI